jgi:hypothetical protein
MLTQLLIQLVEAVEELKHRDLCCFSLGLFHFKCISVFVEMWLAQQVKSQ